MNHVREERGNRTSLSRSHPRWAPLTFLCEKLTALVYSDALPAGETALDYGCGNKPYEALFKTKFSRFVAADFAGNKDANITIGPGGELPLEDESVDCVLSTQVLEHVQSPGFYLSEARRVLKPSGSLILSTHGVWRYHPDPRDYWRWTIEGLRRQVDAAGFDIWLVKSVLGMAPCAVQLWQDATLDAVPVAVRKSYVWVLQSLIGVLERRQRERLSLNASIYVIFAMKRTRLDLTESEAYQNRVMLAAREAAACVPSEASVIFVDQDELGPVVFPTNKRIPFVERDGSYWGPPADQHEAMREFERLRSSGAEFIVFAWPAHWWLDCYARLATLLRSRYRCLLENDRLVIFDLRAV